jgi:patatin-like phospholipase/acyl hydrolase
MHIHAYIHIHTQAHNSIHTHTYTHTHIHSTLSVREAALRTSAAPTFFPLHCGYTDGAIYANNPSLVGVAKIKAHFPRLKTMNIRVLSIGTGAFPYSIDLQVLVHSCVRL